MTSIHGMDSENVQQSDGQNVTLETRENTESPLPSLIEAVEFAENQEPRCPCVLLLDTSESMKGQPIDSMNEGLRAFRTDILEDPVAPKRIEVAVVTFDTTVRLVQDFVTVDRFEPPLLTAQGITHTGAAVNTALDLIQERKNRYKEAGIPYYRPWVLMITDGDPQGELFLFVQDAARRIKKDVGEHRLVFYTVATENAQTYQLFRMGFSPILKLDGLKFNELFVWLSRSMQAVSSEKTGGKFSFLPTRWAKK